MGFLRDLVYFVPSLGVKRAASLAAAKAHKAVVKRRLAAELRRGESDEALLRRLGLPADGAGRRKTLATLWEPLRHLGLGRDRVLPGATDSRARAILAGRQVLFGREVEVGWPPRWGWRWDGTEEQAAFAEDVRSTWEVQRLQGLLPLARAAAREGDDGDLEPEEAAAAYLLGLADFARVHPGPGGLAWSSALEVGLRLVALAQGLPLVVGSEAWRRSDLVVLRQLDRHARWLAADLSLDKVVRGNHLLGELAGLTVAGALLPEARSAWWGELDIQALLEQEVLTQFHPDGVSVEQSIPYEKFILEFLVVAAGAAAARGRPFSDAARQRLRRTAAHLRAVLLPDGRLPTVGDCDGGRGGDWGDPDPLRPDHVLELADRLFDRERGEPPAEEAGAGPAIRHFPSGGHLVLHGRAGRGIYLFLRGGPFGWGVPGPASHSHCDWLAPVLHLDGEPILTDPGVYGYRVGGGMRDAFRTWTAHSTVRPQDAPPRPAGVFRWAAIPGDAGLHWNSGRSGVEIEGTVSLSPPGGALLWHRLLRYNELEGNWLILDRFSGAYAGPLTWGFHFAPGVSVREEGESAIRIVSPLGREYRLRLEPAGTMRLRSAWTAPGYGSRLRSVVLERHLPEPPDSAMAILAPIVAGAS